jgi:hypothetical protein
MWISNSSSSLFLSKSHICCDEYFDDFFFSPSFFSAPEIFVNIDLINHRNVSFFFPSFTSSILFLIAECSFSSTGASNIWRHNFSSTSTLENAHSILSIGSASKDSYVFNGNVSAFW